MTRALSITRAAAHANPTHIYVMATSDGVVKIGRTSNPRTRFNTLRSEARANGAVITDAWVSRHPNPQMAESHLRFMGRSVYPMVSHERFEAPFAEFMMRVRWYFRAESIALGTEEPAPI